MKVKLITKTFPFLIRMNKNNVSLLSSLIIALKKCICKIIKTPSALEFTYIKKRRWKKKINLPAHPPIVLLIPRMALAYQ